MPYSFCLAIVVLMCIVPRQVQPTSVDFANMLYNAQEVIDTRST